MLKIVIVCEMLLLLVTVCNACQKNETLDLSSQARELLHELAADDIVSVRQRFSSEMTQYLSEEKLHQGWSGLVDQIGSLNDITNTRETMEGGFRVVYVTAAFSKGYVDIKVAFDRDGKVTGLFFVPSMIWKPPDYTDQQQFTEKSVLIKTGRFCLSGTLTIPKVGRKWPAVVLVHGSGPHDQDETIGPNKPFKDIAWGLATRGIVVLRYDKRTLKYGSRAAISPLDMTVEQEVIEDAVSALYLLGQTDGVDSDRLFVLGHSLGGMLVPRIATMANPKPVGLIICAGNARPLEEVLLDQLIYLSKQDGNIDANEQHLIDVVRRIQERINSSDFQPTETIDFLGSKLPGSYFLDLRQYDPVVSARKLRMPMLIVRGERDYQVTDSDQKIWHVGLRNLPKIEFQTYERLNHLFMEGEGPSDPQEYLREGHVAVKVIEDIAKWIKEL